MIDLSNKKIGIVLSGGGAKGIYQVGIFRALEEMGLEKNNILLAGTSIGAMNSLQYACHDTDHVRSFIYGLGNLFKTSKDIADGEDKVKTMELRSKEFMREQYPDESIINNRIPVTACAFSTEKGQTQYYKLSDYSPEDQRLIVLGSGSLPGIMPPVNVGGYLLSDGGVPPKTYTPTSAPDKIPVNALAGEDLDMLIISYLKPHDRADLSRFNKKVKIYELIPSRPLEKIPGTGTSDFRESVLEEHELLGYEETIKFFNDQK
ncbi:MAG: patatin-like phospholipase family protein [Lachnospiraceae bacterium]|nr:patatin-like phospholipase family protein [Lachnospiraceae bacterium]